MTMTAEERWVQRSRDARFDVVDESLAASIGEFANPWHDEEGLFAEVGVGRVANPELRVAAESYLERYPPRNYETKEENVLDRQNMLENGSPEDQAIAWGVGEWTGAQNTIPELRDAIRSGEPDAVMFRDIVASAPPSPGLLYRGMTANSAELDAAWRAAEVGDVIDVSTIGSFTEHKGHAERFLMQSGSDEGVMIQLAKGSPALPVAGISNTPGEAEYLVAGKLRITHLNRTTRWNEAEGYEELKVDVEVELLPPDAPDAGIVEEWSITKSEQDVLANRIGTPLQDDPDHPESLTASIGQFANPWHDEEGLFAEAGAGSVGTAVLVTDMRGEPVTVDMLERTFTTFIQIAAPDAFSGYKAHIYATTSEEVMDIAQKIAPYLNDGINEGGWGAKLSTDRFHELTADRDHPQNGKGVTVYFDDYDTWQADLAKLVELNASRFDHSNRVIIGEEYAGEGVSYRYELSEDLGRSVTFEEYRELYQAVDFAIGGGWMLDEPLEFGNPWHDEQGLFAPKGTGRRVSGNELIGRWTTETSSGDTMVVNDPNRLLGDRSRTELLDSLAIAHELSPEMHGKNVTVVVHSRSEMNDAWVRKGGRGYIGPSAFVSKTDPTTIHIDAEPVDMPKGVESRDDAFMSPWTQNDTTMPAADYVSYARYLATHEYGHVRMFSEVDRMGDVKAAWDMTMGQRELGMSEYGQTNPFEAHAEAFAQWTLSQAVPSSRYPAGADADAIADTYASLLGWGDALPDALVASPAAADFPDPILLGDDFASGPTLVTDDPVLLGDVWVVDESMEFANPWHDEEGLFAEVGVGTNRSLAGISDGLSAIDRSMSPEQFAELTRVIKKTGLKLGDEETGEETDDIRALREAKETAMATWAEQLGMTPEETDLAMKALDDGLDSWRMMGGQHDRRIAMQDAMEVLRSGGDATTPLEQGMLLQKAWSDATFDMKYKGKTEVELSRIVSDGHGDLLSVLAGSGEDFVVDAHPLSSWAVKSAAAGIINRWIGRDVDSVELQSTVSKDAIWLNVWSEPRFRVKDLKASGEFIVDDRNELTSSNVTVVNHPAKKGDAYGWETSQNQMRRELMRDSLRNGVSADSALALATILKGSSEQSVIRRHLGVDPQMTMTRQKYGDPPRTLDDPAIALARTFEERGITGGKVAELREDVRGYEVTAQDTIAAKLGMVSTWGDRRSPDEIIARDAERVARIEGRVRSSAANVGMDVDAFIADLSDYTTEDFARNYVMWEGP